MGIIFPVRVDPLSSWLRQIAKVAINQLKIGQRVVQGVGRKELDVCNFVSKLLQFYSDLKLKILEFIKKQKLPSWLGRYPIEKSFGTIEGLLIGFNCTEGILASQNSYGFRAIYLVLKQEKKVKFFPEQGGYLSRKLIQQN